ncbi:MAG TPA: LLM class F420-dependent oxidoreductase, partial [Acidimicrobiales bacterium]|nr:LLM class F420-dependent oxidoreductase [Acidimicrobiales bacterium]
TTYPLISHPYNPEFVTGEGLTRVARAAEEAGFSGIAFTDHPAPSHKWLTAGGHDALDPFAALSFVAGVTRELRLIPNIVVLPYRNPFLVAKASATIDTLSGGRFVLSVAAGYLRSEYRSLGVDFERRNELFDEALEVLRGVWSTDEFAYEGRGFTASGVTANPKPAHVPIWIGGNSPLSRRRVARYGDGWNPFPAPAQLARTARTRVLETLDDLAPMIEHLHRELDGQGRDPASVEVAFTTGRRGPGEPDFDAGEHLRVLEEMSAIGVTWNSVGIPGDSLDHAVDALHRYGEEVISRFG